MPLDQRWRYLLGTLLLLAAIGLAGTACLGVTAEASTFKAEIFGARMEGSSIVALSIVVFVVAGMLLLKAKKETPVFHPHQSNESSDFLKATGSFGEYAVNPNALRLHRFVTYSLSVAALILLMAVISTTRLF
jgi:hypothetical protein